MALAVALVMPSVALGANEAALRARLQTLKSQSARAGQDYMKAYWALNETSVRLGKTNKKIAKTKKQLAAANKQLNSRANNIYRREGLDLIGFLVGSQSFEEFTTRMDYLSRIGDADATAVAEVKALRTSLFAQKKELVAERKARSKRTAKLKRQRNALQERLATTEAEF
jgi:peptidoglycan hydrolase CwlO-like protein